MENIQLFESFTQRFNYGNFSYFITGSVASIYYGLPRLTHDVDIIIDIPVEKIDAFINLFSAKEFYIPPKETIIEEVARTVRGHFNLIHLKSGFKADLYLIGKDSLHLWAEANKKELKIDDCHFYIAPPEYVILRKLEYFQEGKSEKHLDDIRNMLVVSRELINYDYIDKETISRGLSKEWQKLKK